MCAFMLMYIEILFSVFKKVSNPGIFSEKYCAFSVIVYDLILLVIPLSFYSVMIIHSILAVVDLSTFGMF